jgi:hypothetical protein
MYYLKINCSDCNFHLSVNDRLLYKLDRGGNVNTQLPINTFLLASDNKFECNIIPPKGMEIIPHSAYLKITLLQVESSNKNERTISTFQTPSYKQDDKNPAKAKDTLSGDLGVQLRYKPLMESGITLNSTPALKAELFNKYTTISQFLKSKNVDAVMDLLRLKNQDVASVTEEKSDKITSEIKTDYQSYVNDTSLELWNFTDDKVFLKLYCKNKLACLEVANGNQPLCFINRKDRIAIYVPIFFFRNPATKELEIIR